MSVAILPQQKNDLLPERLAPMTFEEFMEWADEDTHAEWVNGRVIFLSASNRHQLLVVFLLRLISDWVEKSGVKGAVWTAPFLMRPRIGLPGREPDVIFLREENFGRLRENYIEGPGDLVIEVVSPESVRRDHMEKFAEYEAGGVGEYWIVDPTTQTAEFYVRDTGSNYFRRAALESLTEEHGGIYTCEMLGGLQIYVDWLWAKPLPPLFPIVSAWESLVTKATG
ncbi:MAG: Uma2 family endonuclease [Fibrella sp.]|nr:Uma2 family endonuclease [Armatimonadota bacterium]